MLAVDSAGDLAELARICAKQARLTTNPEVARALWGLALKYQEEAAKLDSGVLPDIGDPPSQV